MYVCMYKYVVVHMVGGLTCGLVLLDTYPCAYTLFLPTTSVPTGPPLDLAVASRTTTSITVTWSDPAPDRINDKDGVTGFVVRKNRQRVALVTDRSYTFTGLQPATNYTFEVFAVNDQGRARSNNAAKFTSSTKISPSTVMPTSTPSTKTPSSTPSTVMPTSTPSTPQGQCNMYCIKYMHCMCVHIRDSKCKFTFIHFRNIWTVWLIS